MIAIIKGTDVHTVTSVPAKAPVAAVTKLLEITLDMALTWSRLPHLLSLAAKRVTDRFPRTES